MKAIQCVVFDMDGTLTRTNQLIYDSFNYIAEKYRKRTYSIPEITAMFGPPEKDALLAIVSAAEIDAVMRDYLQFYRAHHTKLAIVYPGIAEVLKDIKRRNKYLAVFTGKGADTTRITLEEFRLDRYFDYVVTGDDVKEFKPSPEGLHNIMKRFSLEPAELLMVGDAVSDVAASKEAGVAMAAVLWDSYGKDRVLGLNPENIFYTVRDFQTWLMERLKG